MKCIFCISKSVGPIKLSFILQEFMKYKDLYNISGVLSYRHGFYLHIVEGEDDFVDQFFEKIKIDFKNGETNVIFDIVSSERAFPKNTVKLILLPSLGKEEALISLMEERSSLLKNISEKKRSMLEVFFGGVKVLGDGFFDNEAVDNDGIFSHGDEINNFSFQLMEWPSFSDIRVNNEIIDLCGLLISRSCPYHYLINQKNLDGVMLREFLGEMNSHGILDIKKNVDTLSPINIPVKSRFYKKMRQFLGLQ